MEHGNESNNRQALIGFGGSCGIFHHGGPQGVKPKADVVADILASIKERRAQPK
jgi:hypothetical protein